MRRFGEDMEQLFDEFGFGRLAPRGFDQMAAWTPQVEVLQRDGNWSSAPIYPVLIRTT
jgi:hypothetical protein